MIHKEQIPPMPNVDANTLKLEGEPLRSREHFASKINEKDLIKSQTTQPFNLQDAKNYLSYVSKEMKDSLLKLLNIIQGEKERRRKIRDNDKEKSGLHGSSKGSNTKHHQISGNPTRINSETLLVTELKKSYMHITEELKEIFVPNNEGWTTSIKDSTKSLASTTSVYYTPKASTDKLINKEHSPSVFKDVNKLIGSKKIPFT